MCILDPDRLALGQVQEKSDLDHLLGADWNCRILHARIPTRGPAIGQVRCSVSRGYGPLFFPTSVAHLGMSTNPASGIRLIFDRGSTIARRRLSERRLLASYLPWDHLAAYWHLGFIYQAMRPTIVLDMPFC